MDSLFSVVLADTVMDDLEKDRLITFILKYPSTLNNLVEKAVLLSGKEFKK